MKNALAILACCVGLAACADDPRNMQISAPFDDATFAPFAATGTGSITGHAWLERGTQTVPCVMVTLMPKTSYIDNIMEIWRKDGLVSPAWDKQPAPYAKAAMREKHCDAQQKGEFLFTDLPEGQWYVDAFVVQSPLFQDPNYSKDTWGGPLIRLVEVSAGKQVVVDLTAQDSITGGKFEKR